MGQTICVFDAYGTLFDVAAAARRTAASAGNERLAKVWEDVAANWRLKQLQYTWLRAIADAHTDFWQVTCDGLDWALEAAGLAGDQTLRNQLLALYRCLDAFPEVPVMLQELKGAGHTTAILSNGSPDMLADAVTAAGIESLLDAVISVEQVRVFKPHQSVYALVTEQFGCQPEQVLFVSSNGWDAAAASGFGFRTAWVNRSNEPVERLPWGPQHSLTDLRSIPGLANQ